MNKKKVAFICVHNSCRSQIAEALGKHLASDIFESYSAGTETKPQINQDAVRIMKEIYWVILTFQQLKSTHGQMKRWNGKLWWRLTTAKHLMNYRHGKRTKTFLIGWNRCKEFFRIMQSLKSPYALYNQQRVGSTLHNWYYVW